ncbi:MAG TPA: sulfatase-like hydrolase/transferase [Planctomycetota bacterium]|nr:sulfatase-like hydrolase/transferase [Planctomycetota bacterium]
MNRRDALVGASALGVSAVVGTRSAGAVESAAALLPRRVLLIDIDDIGHDLLNTAMASGGAPNLKRAFAVGRNYPTFWAAPNCSIFRARLLTGLDAYRTGNLVGRIVRAVDKTFDGPTGTWLPDGLPGRSVKVGKWHCSGANSFPGRLITGGYEAFEGTRGNLNEGGSGYTDWTEWSADASSSGSTPQSQFATTRVAQRTLQEMEPESEFVHASFHAIHEPLEQPPDGEPQGHIYSGTSDPALRANMLFHLDHWLGVLLEAAWRRGYVAIVACDNGSDGEGKGTHTEPGIRTPMVVLGRGVTPGTSTRLVQATDLWATVRRLRGDPAAATAADSHDFSDDFLSVAPVAPPRDHLSVDWFPYLGVVPPASKWSRAVRDARWKYVDQKIPPNGILLEPLIGLWDLLEDPDETVNLLDAPLDAAAAAALAQLLTYVP